MKRFDDAFFSMYNDCDIEPATDAETDLRMIKAYNRVLQKAGLPRRAFKRRTKLFLAVAVVAAATLTAAAAYYTVQDAFRGTLEMHDSASRTVSHAEPVLNRAGVLLEEKGLSDGVEMSLRAAVMDEHHLKVLLDVVNTTGEPLAIKQADGSLSKDNFALEDYTISLADGTPINYGATYHFIDSDPNDNKMTIMLEYTTSGAAIRGQQICLNVRDLMQSATLKGTALDMPPDALYDIVSSYSGHTEADFRVSGYSETDGNVQYSYDLITDTDKRTPLSRDTTVKITNAAVRDGVLHLRGIADTEEDLDRIMNNTVLVNSETGDSIRWTGMGRDDDPKKWVMYFEGVSSLDALKGYRWYYGEGYGLHIAAGGTWDFTFQAKAENTTTTLSPKRLIEWDGYPLTVNKLELSPFTLTLEYSTDAATAEKMNPHTEWGVYSEPSKWIASRHPVTLHMKDGTTILLAGSGFSSVGEPYHFQMDYVLDEIIDPAQVSSIEIAKEIFKLN